jgi:Right handed beta helix region
MSVHLLLAALFSATAAAPPIAADPVAVKEVLSGKRTDANAVWWGFDQDDATDSLQAAINSGAKRVIVPNLGADWIVRPITLAGDQELVLEKGVVITAKRGEFQGSGDCVFIARDLNNLTIHGFGATVRMQKEDYIVGTVLDNLGWHRWYGPYKKAEWRTVLALRGCTSVEILGVTLRDSGGDGIYIDGGSRQNFCRNVHIKDVLCDNNYRQGISVISVDGLVVEDSQFNNTWGTPPSSGVDIEPDAPDQKVKRVVFQNCRFEDNYGDGIEVFLSHQHQASDDVSILFENCHVSSRRGSGIRVTKVADRPKGLIEFRNCTVEDTQAYGIMVQDKSVLGARVRFVDCKLAEVARNRGYHGMWTPIWLHPVRAGERQKLGVTGFAYARFGGIDFVKCTVEDDRDRAVIASEPDLRNRELFDITGTIMVKNLHGAKSAIGDNQHSVTFVVKPWKDTAVTHGKRGGATAP